MLLGHRVIQVACGSRDAQTLALTDEGMVFLGRVPGLGGAGWGGRGIYKPTRWIQDLPTHPDVVMSTTVNLLPTLTNTVITKI